jgi:predicted dehydrogenase
MDGNVSALLHPAYLDEGSPMRSLDRRRFLEDTAALAASLAATPAVLARADANDKEADIKPAGPNETLRVAVCGVHGRGKDHIQGWSAQKDVRITAICDVDLNTTGSATRSVARRYGAEPKVVQDIRRLLDDKNIDAISVATPNHWHALATIWACQAGKDVYVEKPVSHNVSEGRRTVEAARKYERIVQTGTQCRSHKGIQDAMAFLRSGKLGQIYMAKGLCYKPRGSIGHKSDAPVPSGVDYDIWLGPTPKRPFNPNRFHYNWHWNWDYGNGDLGNQGIHQMDLARWGLGKSELPKAVLASGGRFGYSDDGQTPNTLTVHFEFDDCQLQFEVRGLITNDESKVKIGDIFYGTEGILAITTYENWQSYFGPRLEKGPGGSGGGDHYANFVKAVKARDPKLLNADIEQGHLSSAYCHLGNIAYRLGRKLHLNPSTESFVSDSEADGLLTRDYRAPYVVPPKV